MASIRSMPVNVTAGQITRTYLCRGEGGKVYTLQVGLFWSHLDDPLATAHKHRLSLQLSHNTVSGDRVLSLDGVEIAVRCDCAVVL